MRKLYVQPVSGFCISSLLLFCSIVFTFNTVKAQVAGNALSYNGVDQYTTLPGGIVQNVTGDFTIETWIFWRGGNNFFPRILDLGNDGNNFVALTAAIPFGSNGPRFLLGVAGNYQVVDALTTIPTNTWVHLAVTLDAATNTANLFINGVLNNTAAGFTNRLSSLGATTGNWLGGRSQFADPYFDGIIDEIRISNIVRYTGTFTPHTTPHTPDANTVVYYRFEEGTGQTSVDATGNFAAAILGGSTLDTNNDPTWLNTNLPVRLHSFDGFVNARSINLRWKAQMDAASTFEVQRSTDGIRFTPVGTITEANGTTSAKTFSLADGAPLAGRNYYRLKYQETGGPVLYSRVIYLVFDAAGKPVVYPNPLRGNFINIDFVKPLSGEAELRLVNAAGVEVSRQKTKLTNQREWQVTKAANLRAGTYILSVTLDGKQNFATTITVE